MTSNVIGVRALLEMDDTQKKLESSIKSNAANLFIVAALYIGYAFFELSLIYDVAILTIIGISLIIWKSRIAAIAAAVFGCISTFFILEDFDGVRLLAAVVIFISGCLAIYNTVRLNTHITNQGSIRKSSETT